MSSNRPAVENPGKWVLLWFTVVLTAYGLAALSAAILFL